MPIRTVEPPREAAQAVAGKLEGFASPDVANPSALGGSDPGAVELTRPHETFVLGLDALGAADPLAAAQPVGWRYLLGEGDRPVAAAETVGAAGGEQRFALFNSGPHVAGTAEAIDAAEALPQAREQDLVVRLLSVPGIALRAVWLHGDSDDLLVPLAPAPPGVEPGRAYAPGDLVAAVADQAAQVASIGSDGDLGA